MRKKCASCELIGFANDEVCRRCGSDKIFKYPEPEELPKIPVDSKKNLPIWSYLICFVLACIIEFIALLPVLANLGMRHSAAAPVSEFEKNSQIAAFILHLPTSIFAYVFWGYGGEFIFINAPFIQIIFWTLIFAKLWRKINNKLK